MSEKKPEKLNAKSLIMIAGMIAAIALVGYIMTITGQMKTSSGCNVNPQSPWGQSQPSVWVDLDTYGEAKAVTNFDFTYPETPRSEYPDIHYRAYTKEIFEVWYTDDAGKEGIRMAKKYSCDGSEIYEVKKEYRSVNIVDIGDVEVKEYGDGESVSVASWSVGDYSYEILVTEDPMAKEELEALIPKMK